MKEIQDRIIEYIKKNRVSTTEVADCMGKTGVLKDANSVNRGQFAVGRVKWIYAYDASNWPVHEQMRDIQEGEVVLIEAFNCDDRAIIGELVTKFAVLYRGASAVVTNCNLRDGNDLIKEDYPVWCKGFNPVGCFNTKPDRDLDEDIVMSHKEKYDGSIAVCDDTGVVIVPREYHTEEFVQKLTKIEEQEDIWFECLDRFKWDTYDIVCLKRYLNE